MASDTELLELTDRDSVLTRMFDAPREKVFKAWTVPSQLAQWFGPHNFTTPDCQVDLRPGGAYRIVMRSPEGVDYPVKGTYRAIVEPDLLVYSENLDEHPEDWKDTLKKSLPAGEKFSLEDILTTVSFEDQNGKTKLTVKTRFASPAVRDAFMKMGMSEGWEECFQRLDTLLSKTR